MTTPTTQREADEPSLISRTIDAAREALGWAGTTQDRRKALDLLSAARAAIDQSTRQAAPEAPASVTPTTQLTAAIYRVVELNNRREAWHDLNFAIQNLEALTRRATPAATTASAIGGQRWSKEAEMMESWSGTAPSRRDAPLDDTWQLIEDLATFNGARGMQAVNELVGRAKAIIARAPLPAQAEVKPLGYVSSGVIRQLMEGKATIATISGIAFKYNDDPIYAAPPAQAVDVARDAAPEAPIGDMVFLPRAIVDSTLDALRKAQMFKVSTALSSAISPVAAPEAPAMPRPNTTGDSK